MKNGWQYVQINGANEKMAPMTLIDNVLMSENGVSLASAIPSNPNLLINGDFQVWQRGTSGFASAGYTADRWHLNTSGASVWKSALNGHASLKMTVESPWTWRNIKQFIEHPEQLSGKTVTLSASFWNQIQTTLRLILNDVALAITTTAVNNTLHLLSVTCTLPTILSTDRLYVYLSSRDETGGYINVEYIKLEIGPVATPNVPRPYAQELAMCKRYFEQGYREYPSVSYSTSSFDVFIQYDVEKRTNPTVTFLPDEGYSNWRYYNNGYFEVGSITELNRSDNTRLIARCTKNASDTTMTANSAYEAFGYWTADAEIY